MDKKLLNSMFENLLHIGNKTNYWSPRMKNYIYGSVNGIHVINLVKTWEKLEEVRAKLKEMATEGKKILFVATKLQARDSFQELAEETGHFYVCEKWVPGLLTNFKTIKRRINTYLKLIKDNESWALNMLTKKEKAAKMLELEKLDKAFKWLKEMKKIPEILFAVDWIYEKQAIKEANTLKLNVFSVFNTNWDDSLVENLIPANTNSVKSLAFLASSLKETLAWVKVVRNAAPVKRITEKRIPSAPKASEASAPAVKPASTPAAKPASTPAAKPASTPAAKPASSPAKKPAATKAPAKKPAAAKAPVK